MARRRGLAALLAAGLAIGVAGCGGAGESARPAHRPISVIYVAGAPDGPWAARTEGLADGVKLAVADRNGIAGERAISTVVVPVVQRDGDQVSAAIGAGRILRDSRTLAVLGTYSALDLPLVVPQLNGGELALLQYGSGMDGLTTRDPVRHEPERLEPSGRSFSLRGVASDEAVAQAIARIPGTRGIAVVSVDTTARQQSIAAANAANAAASAARERALRDRKDGDPLPSMRAGDTTSVYTAGMNDTDAARMAQTIQRVLGGTLPPASEARRSQVVVIDAAQRDPAAVARAAARRSTGTLILVDTAGRDIPAAAVAGHVGPVYRLSRPLADPITAAAQRIRARERAVFGRDRGDAVVAGYRAAQRILTLVERQPDKTIDRPAYAAQLVGDAPSDPELPVARQQVTLAGVVVERLSGGRWSIPQR